MRKYGNLCEVLRHHANHEGAEGITFIQSSDLERKISYKELYHRAQSMLYVFQMKGIGKNDELVFQVEDDEIFICAFWACLLGGIIPVPITVGSTDEQMLKLFKVLAILKNPYLLINENGLSKIEGFAAGTEYKKACEEIKKKLVFVEQIEKSNTTGIEAEIDANDIAFIQFSSGSTGDPKGVVITHENLLYNIDAIINCSKITTNDSILSWMPLTHDMGMIGCHLTPLAMNINLFLMPTALFIKNPNLWLEKTSWHNVTMLSSPNFGYKYLLKYYKPEKAQEWNLSSIRVIFNGAEPISSDLCHSFLNTMSRHGLKRNSMLTVYGMAEASLAVAFPPVCEEFKTIYVDRSFLGVGDEIREIGQPEGNHASFVDVGYAVEHCEFRVCDDSNNPLGDNRVGNIQIRGKNVTRGYYNNPTETKKTMTPDGWLNTGDLGFIKERRLIVTGRAKDIIFVNGQNYYPHDIERVAEGLEEIELGKIAACGVHNGQNQSEELVLFVLFKKRLEEFAKIALRLKTHINACMGLQVHAVVPVRKIPKTTSGKIQRYKLGKMYQDGEFTEAWVKVKALMQQLVERRGGSNAATKLQLEMLEVCRQVLGRDNISADSNFFEWGINSLELTGIVQRLDEKYHGKVTVTDLFAYPSIAKLAEHIENEEQISVEKGQKAFETDESDDMAIIGMAVRLPKADGVEQFWENIRSGRDCIGDFPKNRMKDIDAYMNFLEKDGKNAGYMKGAYLDEIDRFDHELFRLNPMEASLMHPNQRIFLETVWQAIADAGYSSTALQKNNVGVYLGYIGDTGGSQYKKMICDVDSTLSALSMTGNLPSIIPSRISYLLDLKGPAMLVDTACSSSLVAVHLACQGLTKGDCNMAIAGGVKVSLMPLEGQEKIGMESHDGKARAFDDDADGTGMGEGAAVIVLKPLRQALKDRDNIYAIIKGSAINQDGSSAGITAPNVLAQADVIDAAWRKAGINPETISYIEAHGTGTRLGDPVEVDGIRKAFRRYTNKNQFCAIGSVKTNIGHLFEAAGIASLIKSVLALKHGEIPPSINFNKPNKEISFEDSPVYVNDLLCEWEKNEHPRRCGVSAFGFSGTNCHVILEEAPAFSKAIRSEKGVPNILTMSAMTEQGLRKLVNRYQQFTQSQFDIGDVCFTANTGRDHYRYRAAIIVNQDGELKSALDKLLREDYATCETQGIFGFEQGPEPICEAEKENLSEQAKALLVQYIETGKTELRLIEQICRLYVRGADIDWGLLYEGESFNRVSIPLYPLNRKRCWLEIPSAASEGEGHLYYALDFKREELVKGAKQPCGKNVIVFRDETGRGDAICSILKAGGHRVTEVIKRDTFMKTEEGYAVGDREEDYVRLLNELDMSEASNIIHMLSLSDHEAQSVKELEQAQERGLYSLYYLIRAMYKNHVKGNIELVLVSNYANRITGEEEYINPENAAMFALGKAVEQEYPGLRIRCIDIDRHTTTDELYDAIKWQQEYRSSYRSGVRYIEQFRRVETEEGKHACTEIKEDGVYVITGGLGGIGLEVAKHLAEKASVRLGLVNRTKMPKRSLWDEMLLKGEDEKVCRRIKAVKEIEAKGSMVECLSADVSSLDQMKQIMEALRQKYGRIDGVIHAAGVAGDGFIVRKDEKTFNSVIRPKIHGTWVLDHVTREDQLDFLVFFSSAASILTVQGQGDYAAGNAYMDSYAGKRNRKGSKTLSINWAAWKETGMAADYGVNTDTVLKALGTKPAVEAFERVLSENIHNVLIGELNLDSSMLFMLERFPFKLSKEIRRELERCRKRLEAAQRMTETEKQIAEVCRQMLGIDEVDTDQNFFDLGADSIMLTRLVEKLENRFPGKITVAKLFGYPTISKLAEYLDQQSKSDDTTERLEDSTKAGTKEGREGYKVKDIAVIGMAARMPGADNKEEFWDIIRTGQDCIKPFPASRKRDINSYLAFTGVDIDRIGYVDGGYLDAIDRFDYKFFRITPKDASLMDPNQRLFLEIVYETMEDAGYGGDRIAGSNTGVYAGFGSNFRDNYGKMVADTDPGSLSFSIPGNIPALIPGRVSYLFDLKGPCMLVDTACSSSLVAVHLACDALKKGECDMAIAGGVKINLMPVEGQITLGIESSDNRTRAFDDSSDGTGTGEGVAAVMLKPLAKALEDGDNIHAVIKGSAVNQDGSSAGITAPNMSAQTRVILNAWKDAGVHPETISYIEAHGTGTKIGDPIEIEALTEAFRRHTQKKQFCAIGAVKTNIGHLYEAAGIAGLIKAILSLEKRTLAPTIHFKKPNHRINFEDSPVYVNTELTEWKAGDTLRRCGVSAFGLSGTNCHMVLEEAPLVHSDTKTQKKEPAYPQVLALSAKSETALKLLMKKYANVLGKGASLKELCYTANTSRGHYECRLCLVSDDPGQMKEKLEKYSTIQLSQGCTEDMFYGRIKTAYDSNAVNPGALTRQDINSLSREAELKIKAYMKKDKADTQYLKDICTLYVKGANVNWEELYKDGRYRKMSLPTYPFDRGRCWVHIPDKACSGQKHAYNRHGHMNEALEGIIHKQNGMKDTLANLEGFLNSDTLPQELSIQLQAMSSQLSTFLQECEDYAQLKSGSTPETMEPEVVLTGKDCGDYTQTEIKVAQIWCEVLGINELDVTENYFAIGGDSIKAIRIASRLKESGADVNVNDLLQYQTISSLAEFIDSVCQREVCLEGKINPTPMQKWMMKQHKSICSAIHTIILFKPGGFDEEKARLALQKLAEHHDALRISLLAKGEDILQFVREIDGELLEFEVQDFTGEQDYEHTIRENAQQVRLSFDLFKPPLFKVKLFKTKGADYMLIAVPQLIADDFSLKLLLKGFQDAYCKMQNNEAIAFPQKSKSFAAWCRRLMNLAEGNRFAEESDYWKRIKEAGVQTLPVDKEAAGNGEASIGQVCIQLSSQDAAMLMGDIHEVYNTKPEDLLLMAVIMGMEACLGVNKVLVSIRKNAREVLDGEFNLETTVGQFDYMYPVLLDISQTGDMPYRIKAIKESLRQVPEQGIHFGIFNALCEDACSEPAYGGLTSQIAFRYMAMEDRSSLQLFEIKNFEMGCGKTEATPSYNFEITAKEQVGGVVVQILYHTGKYKETTVMKFAENFRNSLTQIMQHCASSETIELTPSDLGNDELSIEEVDEILALYKEV